MKLSNIRTKNHHIQLEEYSNIREFVRVCDGRTDNSWSDYNIPNDSQRDHLMYGWDEARKEIDKELTDLGKLMTKDKKLKEKVYTTNGYYPNVGKALRGNIKCMGKYKKTSKVSKIVEVIWDPGAAAYERAETIRQQGVKLLAKIKSMELCGYRVKLLVQGFKGESGTTNSYMCRICIKEENQPLDLSRIAYPLAQVEMLRTWMFHWYERLPEAKHICGYGVSLYKWRPSDRQEILDGVNVKGNQYYVNLNTDIEEMFKPMLGGK